MDGIKDMEPCCFHFERSSGRDQTMCTSYGAQRSEPKRTSTTLSVNPTKLPTKRLDKQCGSTSILDGCWLVKNRTANSNPSAHHGL